MALCHREEMDPNGIRALRPDGTKALFPMGCRLRVPMGRRFYSSRMQVLFPKGYEHPAVCIPPLAVPSTEALSCTLRAGDADFPLMSILRRVRSAQHPAEPSTLSMGNTCINVPARRGIILIKSNLRSPIT